MANTIDLSQFHEVFFEESFEGLAVMESGLLDLDPSQPATEVINNVFRAAHSIKGGAATFGFTQVSEYTHLMETLLDEVRSETMSVTDELIERLLEAVDFLKHMLQESQADRKVEEAKIEHFTERLVSYDPTLLSDEASVANDEEQSPVGETWKIRFAPKPGLFQSGNDPYRIIRELSELGEVSLKIDGSALPDIAELNPEECFLSWDIELSNCTGSIEEVRELFEWIEEDADVVINAVTADEEILEVPAVIEELIEDQDIDTTENEVEQENEQVEQSTQSPVTGKSLTEAEVKTDNVVLQNNTPEVTSIRVNIDRVDMLVNLVGELVITQSMLSQFKDANGEYDPIKLIRGIEQLEENTREIQEHTMRIRMLPIDNVFQRMPRLVRDLSRSLDKDVELVLLGNTTEVDKTVLEKISDPLTHLVRNCLDHGIETPDTRIAAGKPGQGKVTISAYHEGGNIVIEVKDDGRGLNREAILAKAVEKGVVEQGEELSDNDIEQLIFSPGFSTAAQISDVSGRGVGMDVVRNNIEQLNGHIDVVNEPGQGSTFIIRLPLTLAIIEGQLVRVGTDVFVVPILSIIKSTRIDQQNHNVVGGESDMYRLEDEYLPVVQLKDVYSIDSDYDEVSDGILVIVDAKEKFGILVDEVLGQQQVVVKSLETNFRSVPTISGATILGDGTVAMILDMAGLMRETKLKNKIIEAA